MNLRHSVFIVQFSIENTGDNPPQTPSPTTSTVYYYFYSYSNSLMFTSTNTQVVNSTEQPPPLNLQNAEIDGLHMTLSSVFLCKLMLMCPSQSSP